MQLTAPPTTDRSGIEAYLKEALTGLYTGPARAADTRGGRQAALERLHTYDARRYGRTRNFTDAPVSQLSPYLRHGLLSLSEVRDYLKRKYNNEPEVIEELLRQLAWRDYFLHVLHFLGEDLFQDVEEPKHPVPREGKIPLTLVEARTGLPCMDGMMQRLIDTGYLHNHERLWFAAFVCHYLGVDWQAGAALFYQYLLDGENASNLCSWQWVESTFASKPYFMNRENIERYSGSEWCATCNVKCPFEGEYPHLEKVLFERGRAPLADRITDTRSYA